MLFNRAHRYRFLAVLIFMGLHDSDNGLAQNMWTSGMGNMPFIHAIMTYAMYTDIKSALHLQDDNEEETDMNGFPLMRKIGM